MHKIKVAENIEALIERQNRTIEVTTSLPWDIEVEFAHQDQDISLDESGDIFEPVFELALYAKPKQKLSLTSSGQANTHKKEVAEIMKFFDFVNDNKKNLFEMTGVTGVVE
jgi:hypothetical protein